MDLFPTLIEACGLPAKPEIDGRSFVPLPRDPLQWTNLATSNDPEILTMMKRLAASFPSSFAPDVAQSQGGKAEQAIIPDPTIRAARTVAKLK